MLKKSYLALFFCVFGCGLPLLALEKVKSEQNASKFAEAQNQSVEEGLRSLAKLGAEIGINYTFHTVFIQKHAEFLFSEIEKNHDAFFKVLKRKVNSPTNFWEELDRYVKANHTFVDSLKSAQQCWKPIAAVMFADAVVAELKAFGVIPSVSIEESVQHLVLMGYNFKTEGVGNSLWRDFCVYGLSGICTAVLHSAATVSVKKPVMPSLDAFQGDVVKYLEESGKKQAEYIKACKPFTDKIDKVIFPLLSCFKDWFKIKTFSKFCRNLWFEYVRDNTSMLYSLMERYEEALKNGNNEELAAVKTEIMKFIEDAHKNYLPLRHAIL